HRCERLHGHNYRTRVVVEGGLDPEAHYVLDFSMLKDLMKRLTDEIDHKVLLPLESAKIHVSEEGDTVRVAVAGKPRSGSPRGAPGRVPSGSRRRRAAPRGGGRAAAPPAARSPRRARCRHAPDPAP